MSFVDSLRARMISHDSIRSLAATFLLALYLPVPLYMAWIHAGHRLWKRIGPVSYALHLSLYAAMVAAIIRAHGLWPWHAWPWPVWVSWLGVLPLAVAAWLAFVTYRTIPARTLLTFRQIGAGGERRLVRDGVLGSIRHPRYVMYALLALGNSLVAGFPLVLASLAATCAVLAVVILLEEREMKAHFGEEFEKYRRETPAFLPRRARGARLR